MKTSCDMQSGVIYSVSLFVLLCSALFVSSVAADAEQHTFQCQNVTTVVEDDGTEARKCLEWTQLEETDNSLTPRYMPRLRTILMPGLNLDIDGRVNCIDGQKPDAAGICRESW